MIDKLSYDEILSISKILKEQGEIVDKITKAREIDDLADFIATVEGYSKFLENTIEINKDADSALNELKNQIKYNFHNESSFIFLQRIVLGK